MKRTILLAILLLTLVSTESLFAARIRIVNKDGPNEGFNDPTPAAPVGGNSGTTIGQQRLNAFQYAADLWGAILDSEVEILVSAQFDALECGDDGAVLGGAAATRSMADFDNAPRPGVWYPSALADKYAREDLAAGEDIFAQFNSALDNATCLADRGWYYGLDTNHGADTDLVVVVLHELAHGLGFAGPVNLRTGTFAEGIPDIFSLFVLDNATGLRWDQMSDAQRATSAKNTGGLVWDGPAVTAASPAILKPTPVVTINAPAAVARDYVFSPADFGGSLTIAGVTASVVQVLDPGDAAGLLTTDACSTISNPAAVAGKIALIDRGTCPFVFKVKNAQDVGALAVIIVDNQAAGNPPIGMGGSDPTIVIPVVSITQADGGLLKAQLSNGLNATLRVDPLRLSGVDSLGKLKLYAPNPLEPGSSVYHWDRSASPNLLMEPFIGADVKHDLDLTLDHFRDIGWITGSPAVTATKQDSMVIDADGDGAADPGDTIRYTITVTNPGAGGANNARLIDVPDSNTSLVVGSVTTTKGTIITGNAAGHTSVEVDLGTLAETTGTATVVFQVRLKDPLPTAVRTVSNRATVSGSNFEIVNSNDPDTGLEDATLTQVDHAPVYATKTAVLVSDADGNGGLSRGEVLRYSIVIRNGGSGAAPGIILTDTPDPNSSLIVGTVASSQGTVTSGNALGQSTVAVNVGTIAFGGSVTIFFDVRANSGAPTFVTSISNQASISSSTFVVMTDDPATTTRNDATETRFASKRKRAGGRR